jgi:hypothetical protein
MFTPRQVAAYQRTVLLFQPLRYSVFRKVKGRNAWRGRHLFWLKSASVSKSTATCRPTVTCHPNSDCDFPDCFCSGERSHLAGACLYSKSKMVRSTVASKRSRKKYVIIPVRAILARAAAIRCKLGNTLTPAKNKNAVRLSTPAGSAASTRAAKRLW